MASTARLPTLIAIFSSVPLVTPASAAAQSAGHAFEALRVDLYAVANVNSNTFHEYWDPNLGVELNVETPFYFGTAELGLHYNAFDGEAAEQPDFDSFFPYVGWGYDWPATSRLSWYNGLRIGSMLMRFDADAVGRTEQDLGIGLNSRLRFALGGSWSVDFSARYRVVFTHERLRLFFIVGGISRSFRTPGWLRAFLE